LAFNIEGSVGLCGRNYPIDVAVVQKLLIDYFTQIIPVKRRSSRVITPAIAVDGEGKNCSYKDARQIINGTDNHVKIAGHADKIEILLRLCVQ